MPETMDTKDADYEFFKPGADGRKEGQKPTDKRFALVGGVLGLGGVAYMARQVKNRPKNMKLSVYLIHTRLLAQGTVIGVITLGMINQMWAQSRAKLADY